MNADFRDQIIESRVMAMGLNARVWSSLAVIALAFAVWGVMTGDFPKAFLGSLLMVMCACPAIALKYTDRADHDEAWRP